MLNTVVKIVNKVAHLVEDEFYFVCENSDYTITFDFDSEWDKYTVKTARFICGNEYTDVVFEGNVCPVPVLYDVLFVKVGVTAGELHTSTPALIKCKPSILGDKGLPKEPTEDVYAQIVGLCESTKAIAQSVRDDADNGVFDGKQGEPGKDGASGKDGVDGKDGKDGYTPVRGTDYWTESDKAEIKSYVDEAILGGAW